MCRELVPPPTANVVFGSFSLQWILSICLGEKRKNHVCHRNQENQKIIEGNPITYPITIDSQSGHLMIDPYT
jgi:hypothetical protein